MGSGAGRKSLTCADSEVPKVEKARPPKFRTARHVPARGSSAPRCAASRNPAVRGEAHSGGVHTRVDRSLIRWAVPVGAAAVVGAVAVAPGATAASAHPRLPARSAAQLIAAVEQCRVQALSGTVETTANLGLPQLPDRFAGGGTGLQALLTGTHQLRVWIAGPGRQRVALLGDLAETDMVHNGHDLWTYQSATNAVTHRTLPTAAGPHAAAPPDTARNEASLTPEAAAAKLLHAVDPSTVVTVDRTARVAGRPAYQIVLTPRTHATLLRSVRIAVDATTSLPLRVQLFAGGSSTPAWQTAFTRISFTTPSASVFRFSPPRGAAISNATGTSGLRQPDAAPRRSADRSVRPTTVGNGWASVIELPAGTVSLTGPSTEDGPTGGRSVATLLDRVTKPVAGGRLLTTRLLSVLITNDGRVFLGAVPAHTVEQAAAAAGG